MYHPLPQKSRLAHRQWSEVTGHETKEQERDRCKGICCRTECWGDQEVGVGDLPVAGVSAHSGEFPLPAYSPNPVDYIIQKKL